MTCERGSVSRHGGCVVQLVGREHRIPGFDEGNQIADTKRPVPEAVELLCDGLKEQEHFSVVDEFAELLRFEFANFGARANLDGRLDETVLTRIKTGD